MIDIETNKRYNVNVIIRSTDLIDHQVAYSYCIYNLKIVKECPITWYNSIQKYLLFKSTYKFACDVR